MFQTIIKPINIAVQTKITNTLACVQCVQYHRKPRWFPVAKSKMFRIPERPKKNIDEYNELQRLHKNYNTQVRLVRKFIMNDVRQKQEISSADHVIVTPEEQVADMQRCAELNNAWNASIAENRKQRLEKARAQKHREILARLELKIRQDEIARKAAEEAVRLEKSLAKTFILKHNLDEAIEYALANPSDYNFCINLDGEILHGRTSTNNEKDSAVTAAN
ncbi:putative 28S ribosomal protein S26, mitochondrial [Pseudolycoriella hygida]|uniref:Small ribosomal subunit protein mS26 n=1 Tax=Pseudolycoriella hygida TaxID=35572 RepID=A0A9Q0MN73_9DIPT|nr:putative 28S ribosomal protein S26, mitochondrial [Pseudolycoriella hygida]